ncbi:MAG: pyrophosphokinase [Dehalococcoidia bacterium]|nr:pyrophosphokinase [Dehalococcoidia bacterium]
MVASGGVLPSAGEGLKLEDLLAKARVYLPPDKVSIIEQAYAYASSQHQGQMRKSGEPFIQHPLHTAVMVADLRLDTDALTAAILHDVPEDCGVPMEEIEERFGPEVRSMVDAVTKLSRISWPSGTDGAGSKRVASVATVQAESIRKMLLAMAEDIRVVIIKLADRLHNMRTLEALPPQRRLEISQETMEIYAPLAHRLGIFQFEWELEDLAFRYLEPEEFREVAKLVAAHRTNQEEYVARAVELLQTSLNEAGIKADVVGRPKHLYSIYKKMNRYEEQGKEFGQIYDILALRVLVDEVQDCYSALGIVHQIWHPIPGEFDDYIANPKESMYQSIHSSVWCVGSEPVEVQIRTHEMHRIAEYGVAAHWRYKDGAGSDPRFEEKLTWLRQILEWHRDVAGAEEFVESVKTDIFHDQVLVYTPKGDIRELPVGSTPLDFAFKIHSDLGYRCVGAKVSGRLVPLNSQLRTGDVVEIVAGKRARGPSRDWLNLNLGYLKTSNAREKVRQWFRKLERAENVAKGQELLEKELKRMGITMGHSEIARVFDYNDLEDFYLALGNGDVSAQSIALKVATQEEQPVPIPQAPTKPTYTTTGVKVTGVGDLLTRIARCCHAVPGDDIIGYVTRTSGIAVHRVDCRNILNEDEKERLIRVEWGSGGQMYSVPVLITAWDRVGLLRDIATLVSAEGINILLTNQAAHTDGTASFNLVLETTGLSQLGRLMGKIEGISGVRSVARVSEAGAAQ